MGPSSSTCNRHLHSKRTCQSILPADKGQTVSSQITDVLPPPNDHCSKSLSKIPRPSSERSQLVKNILVSPPVIQRSSHNWRHCHANVHTDEIAWLPATRMDWAQDAYRYRSNYEISQKCLFFSDVTAPVLAPVMCSLPLSQVSF